MKLALDVPVLHHRYARLGRAVRYVRFAVSSAMCQSDNAASHESRVILSTQFRVAKVWLSPIRCRHFEMQ